MATKSINPADPIVQRLRTIAQESPELKDAAQVYEAILPLLRDADLHVATVSITPEQARAKMEKGLPLLHELDLDLDVEAVRELMLRLATAVETISKKKRHSKLRLPWLSNEPDSTSHGIRRVLEDNRLDVSALLPHIAVGERAPVFSAAQSLQLAPGLVWTLAQNALKPALRSWCRQLTPPVKGIEWHKGSCFVCGAGATLGELQDNDQVKHLRCGSCGADWQFRRLECMHCGNEDHRTQKFLYVDGRRDTMRVEACDVCKGYLKVISSFTPTPAEMLPVEDLATLHLDFIALGRGYERKSSLMQPSDGRSGSFRG